MQEKKERLRNPMTEKTVHWSDASVSIDDESKIVGRHM